MSLGYEEVITTAYLDSVMPYVVFATTSTLDIVIIILLPPASKVAQMQCCDRTTGKILFSYRNCLVIVPGKSLTNIKSREMKSMTPGQIPVAVAIKSIEEYA